MLPSRFNHIGKATRISKINFHLILIVNQYLLFPVEPPSVTVWDVDVTIGLENGEFETSQDSVEQLTTWSLVSKCSEQNVEMTHVILKVYLFKWYLDH